MKGEMHLRRGRLIYRGGDSSIEGETRLWRGRFIYGKGESSEEGETFLRRWKSYQVENMCKRAV
jgi:hypothetical protein